MQQLTAIENIMKSKEFIFEIGMSPGIGELSITNNYLIQHSNKLTDFDTKDIWLYDDQFQKIYFFKSGSEVDAFICVVGDQLRGIKNITEKPGFVTALVIFVVHELKLPLKLSNSEELTSNGLNWLLLLLAANGRGMKITGQTGRFPDSELIEHEWNNALTSNDDWYGPTAIFFESNNTFKFLKNAEDKRIMRTTKIIGDLRLL